MKMARMKMERTKMERTKMVRMKMVRTKMARTKMARTKMEITKKRKDLKEEKNGGKGGMNEGLELLTSGTRPNLAIPPVQCRLIAEKFFRLASFLGTGTSQQLNYKYSDKK